MEFKPYEPLPPDSESQDGGAVLLLVLPPLCFLALIGLGLFLLFK